MTIFDITCGQFRRYLKDRGLDMVTAIHANTGLPTSLKEANVRRKTFLHDPEG